MSEREYWFARRFPLKDPRHSYAPVHWKGYALTLLFVTALTGGGVAFAWLGANGSLFMGVMVFAGVALVAGAWFVLTAKANGDPVRTVADYKKDRQARV
ncbi:MAG: hypothetical protein AB7T59_02380 [Hyphomonadaceae bacterium]